MKSYDAVPCATERYYLGECARWDEVRGELSWVNVAPGTGQFLRARVEGVEVEIVAHYDFPGSLTAVAPLQQRDEGWIIALDDSLLVLGEDGTTRILAAPEERHHGEVRTNDGAADPWGAFWIGSMARDAATGRGSLYRYHESNGVEAVREHLTIANGIGWSPDARIAYHVDSGPGVIAAFDVDERGNWRNERTFARLDVATEGAPDGLCVDEDGNVWVAIWGGREVRQYAPSGEQLASVAVDTLQPSSCALGGPNGTTLYITTAQEGMSPQQLEDDRYAGRLFACEVGVSGLALNPYRRVLKGDLNG